MFTAMEPDAGAMRCSRMQRVQMSVHGTRNHCVSGICALYGILNTRKHNVSKLDLFSSSNERKGHAVA
jgi:hypothetical protein